MSENCDHSNSKSRAIHILSLKKGGVIIYLGVLKKGGYVIYRVPPPRFLTIYGTGSVKKKIDFHVHNPEGCRFMVLPDLVYDLCNAHTSP